jgi:hypothetical protein
MEREFTGTIRTLMEEILERMTTAWEPTPPQAAANIRCPRAPQRRSGFSSLELNLNLSVFLGWEEVGKKRRRTLCG